MRTWLRRNNAVFFTVGFFYIDVTLGGAAWSRHFLLFYRANMVGFGGPPAGIAEAVTPVENSGIAGAGLFVLNIFGPQEAEGRGFCEAIGTALEHDILVLVGVGKGSRAALERFVDGMGETLPPKPDAIYEWCKGAMGRANIASTESWGLSED